MALSFVPAKATFNLPVELRDRGGHPVARSSAKAARAPHRLVLCGGEVLEVRRAAARTPNGTGVERSARRSISGARPRPAGSCVPCRPAPMTQALSPRAAGRVAERASDPDVLDDIRGVATGACYVGPDRVVSDTS
jgi:hypothetical protein